MKHALSLRLFASFVTALLLLSASPAPAESARDPLFTLSAPVRAGDTAVTLLLSKPLSSLKANVFSDGAQIAEKAEFESQSLMLTLSREVQENEIIRVVVEGTDEAGRTPSEDLLVSVGLRQASRLLLLRERVNGMWPQWQRIMSWTADHHQVCVPKSFQDVPFLTWADETPEIQVTETADQTFFRIPGEDLTGWLVQTGEGIPVQYTNCPWDEKLSAYVCPTSFETIYLISPMEPWQIKITLAYERDSGYLPSYPILEWDNGDEDMTIAFNCYGWGTTRSFTGGIYTIVDSANNLYITGEYDHDRNLTCCYDLLSDTAYDADDNLISGEEPEGYACPIVH